MTTVRIDPNELVAAASALRAASIEVADIGSQLSSCFCFPMPPRTQQEVNAISHILDTGFDRLAGALASWANDLTNRAAIASSDMTSTFAVGGAAPLVRSSMLIGGHSSSGITITDPNSGQSVDPSSIYSGMATIGGHTSSGITVIDPTRGQVLDPTTLNRGMAIIGGHTSASSGSSNPAMILARAAQTHRERANAIGNRILANPNSTQTDVMKVFNSQIRMNEVVTRNLAPSRSSMESKLGHLLTMGEYYDMVPEARPRNG